MDLKNPKNFTCTIVSHHLPVPWLKGATEWSLGIMAQSFLMTAFKLICVTLVYSCISKQERSYSGIQSRLLGVRSRNEEAVYSTRNTIYSLKLFTSYFIDVDTFYFFLNWFSEYAKIQGPRFREMTSLPEIKKAIYMARHFNHCPK